MALISLMLTNGGQQALAQASQVGPVVLSKVAIGSGVWTPTPNATALQNEIKRISTLDGGNAGGQIHMTVQDGSTDVYNVHEIGLYTDQNVLFAIYSQSAAIFTKGAADTLFFALDVTFTNVPDDAPITVAGDTNFVLPPASDTQAGIIRLATAAEIAAYAGSGVPSVTQVASMIGVAESSIGAAHDADLAAVNASIATMQTLIDANERRRPRWRYWFANGGVLPGSGGGGAADWKGVISLDGATNACTVHLTGEHYGAGGAAGMTFTGKASGTTILSGSCWSPNDWSTFSAVTAYSLNDNRKLDVTFGGTGSVRNLRCVVIEFPD